MAAVGAAFGPWLRNELREARAAWMAYRASFVFRKELGRWPVVRYTGPGRFVMKAPYTGPRRVQNFSGWKAPVYTGAAFGVFDYFVIGPVFYGFRPDVAASAVTGGFIALMSLPFWRLARKTRFKIRFIDGVMIWRGPDWTRYAINLREEWRVEAVFPHRWTAEEMRKQDQWRATHPGQIPQPLFQSASEVLARSARGGLGWMPVAEFINDIGGDRALVLKTAIDFVAEQAGREMAARARAKAQAETGEL
jgi:hypothetical protein